MDQLRISAAKNCVAVYGVSPTNVSFIRAFGAFSIPGLTGADTPVWFSGLSPSTAGSK